jgi:PAS domain S-box-containing protein
MDAAAAHLRMEFALRGESAEIAADPPGDAAAGGAFTRAQDAQLVLTRTAMKCPPRLRLLVPVAVALCWVLTVAVWLSFEKAWPGHAPQWPALLAPIACYALLGLGLWAVLHFGVIRKIDELMRDRANAMAVAARELVDIKAALDAHSIVAITDAAGRITYVNDKFCEISKYPREELIGQDHRIINSGFHPKSFFQELWRTISSGQVWKGEIKNRAKDGSFYWVDTTIFPIRDAQGRARQYVAIRTDVTQRKENELRLQQLADELAGKNKELETIVYVVSHDLRAPLLNVQGFGAALARTCGELVEKLRSGNSDGVGRLVSTDLPRALRFIEAGISKMDALLTGFLRFSRLGRVELHIEPLDMNRIVKGAAQALKFQAEEAGVHIQIGALPACLGDATLAGQVFSNLLDNALKYREPSRACEISVTGQVADGSAIFTVRDNGIGIPAEHQPKVFELFHRLHPKKTDGEGLGLTIVQRAVERQHGRIWLESEPDQGTSFHVSLPAPTSSTPPQS